MIGGLPKAEEGGVTIASIPKKYLKVYAEYFAYYKKQSSFILSVLSFIEKVTLLSVGDRTSSFLPLVTRREKNQICGFF